MTVENDSLYQKAVYWPLAGFYNNGTPRLGTPIEIDVRWEWTKRTIKGPDGSPVSIDATVDLDREIPQGSQMWLGELEDLPTNTEDYDNLMTVVSYDNIPDIQGVETQRSVQLKRKATNATV